MKTLHRLGLDRTDLLRVDGVEVAPRDVVAAALPDPMTLGDRMRGKTCAGTWVTGTGVTALRARRTCTASSTARTRGSATAPRPSCGRPAISPVIALELLATGAWSGAGVLGPEAFPPSPFLDLLGEYPGRRGGIEDRSPTA